MNTVVKSVLWRVQAFWCAIILLYIRKVCVGSKRHRWSGRQRCSLAVVLDHRSKDVERLGYIKSVILEKRKLDATVLTQEDRDAFGEIRQVRILL